MKAPIGDRLVLLATFGLTVAVDLTVAIEVGVVLAAVLFMHRMSEAVEVQAHMKLLEEDVSDSTERTTPPPPMDERELPAGVVASVINGPFFFGVAMRLGETMDRIGAPPKVFILRMRAVPMIDGTGASAIQTLIDRCARHGTKVIVTAIQPQPEQVLKGMGVLDDGRMIRVANFDEAIAKAREIVEG